MSTSPLPVISTPSARVGRGRLFRIPLGKCILAGVRGRSFEYRKGPDQVYEDEIDSKKIPGYIQNGFLVRLGDHNADDTSISSRVITHDNVRPQGGEGARVPLTDPAIAKVKLPPARLKRRSIFDLDPETLKGKSLDELNLMIVGLAPLMKPCESVEAAIALLSEDHG